MGNSYTAGIGAGKSLEEQCGLYDQSYPKQMHRDSRLASWGITQLNNVPCVGSETEGVLKQQLPSVGNPDLATISTGGNDAHFFRVISACVYRFNGPSSRGCEDEILWSLSELHTDLFYFLESTYNAVLNAVASKDFRLYVTGYAQLFNENTTQCNEFSFNYWSWPSEQHYLSQELRSRTNELVRKLNMEIQRAIDQVNQNRGTSKVVYVDYDSEFNSRRFCEEEM